MVITPRVVTLVEDFGFKVRMKLFTLSRETFRAKKALPLGIELAITRVRAAIRTIEPLAQLIGSGLRSFL